MVHVVGIEAVNYYKVYVDDETGEKSKDRVIEEAREKFLNGEYDEDTELDFEEEDIKAIWHDYDIDD